MPELPEVEALAHDLSERMAGRQVARTTLGAVAALKTYDPPLDALCGREVAGVGRRGKYLLVAVSPETGAGHGPLHLVVHLARSGWVRWTDGELGSTRLARRGPTALELALDGGGGIRITEAAKEKRLGLWVVRDVTEVAGIQTLGPEPLDPAFDASALGAALAEAGERQLKAALSDQRVVAGVGNAYSDEILHAAQMSPYRIVSTISRSEVERLHAAMVSVLSDALGRSEGLGASELKAEKKAGMRVHGRSGQPCGVCGDTIREVSFATKAFQYCPTCQTGGKVLADRRMSRLLK